MFAMHSGISTDAASNTILWRLFLGLPLCEKTENKDA